MTSQKLGSRMDAPSQVPFQYSEMNTMRPPDPPYNAESGVHIDFRVLKRTSSTRKRGVHVPRLREL